MNNKKWIFTGLSGASILSVLILPLFDYSFVEINFADIMEAVSEDADAFESDPVIVGMFFMFSALLMFGLSFMGKKGANIATSIISLIGSLGLIGAMSSGSYSPDLGAGAVLHVVFVIAALVVACTMKKPAMAMPPMGVPMAPYGQPMQPQYGQPAQPQYGQPAQPQYAQPAFSIPAQPAAPQAGTVCSNCGEQLAPGTTFCGRCGQKQ